MEWIAAAATTSKFGQGLRPVDARYSLEGYATLTAARSKWLPDWTRRFREGYCDREGGQEFPIDAQIASF
jgi:hypothetical protein